MVRLLILVTRCNRGLVYGILMAGRWGREYGGNWAKQDGRARVIGMLGHMLRIIDGRGMHDRW